MPFKTKIGDITKLKVDAIVNSLGVDGNIHGKICQCIIDKSKSKELEKFIDSNKNNPIGDIYITSGYKLPCKNIMHLVTPFRHNDNKDCKLLKQNIRKVIDKAIELEYKSLAIPLIGIGFNNYTKEEVYNVLTSVCTDIDNLEAKLGHNLIQLVIVLYFGTKKYDRIAQLNKAKVYNECYSKALEYNKKVFSNYNTNNPNKSNNYNFNNEDYEESGDEVLDCIKTIGKINKSHYFTCHYENYKVPYDFVTEYINTFKIDENERYDNYLDRKRKYHFKHQKSLKKKDAFLIGFFMGFSQTVMNEFLVICGLSYTPGSDLDDFFRSYFGGELGEIEDFYHLLEAYGEFSDEDLAF